MINHKQTHADKSVYVVHPRWATSTAAREFTRCRFKSYRSTITLPHRYNELSEIGDLPDVGKVSQMQKRSTDENRRDGKNPRVPGI